MRALCTTSDILFIFRRTPWPRSHGCLSVVIKALKILSTFSDLALVLHPQAGKPLETGWKGNKDAALKSELSKKIAAQQEGRSKKSGDDDTKKKKKK